MELIQGNVQDLVQVRYVIYTNEEGLQKFRELAVSDQVKGVSATFSTMNSKKLREIGLLYNRGERVSTMWGMDLAVAQRCEFRLAKNFYLEVVEKERFNPYDFWKNTLGILPKKDEAKAEPVPTVPVTPIVSGSSLPEPIKRILPVSAELLERPAQDLSDQELKDAKLAITLVIEQLQTRQEELTDMQQSRAKDKRAQLLASKAELEAQLAAIEEEERLLRAELDPSDAQYAS